MNDTISTRVIVIFLPDTLLPPITNIIEVDYVSSTCLNLKLIHILHLYCKLINIKYCNHCQIIVKTVVEM